MKKLRLFAIGAFAFTIVSNAGATDYPVTVRLLNNSAHCIWATFYQSSGNLDPWHAIGSNWVAVGRVTKFSFRHSPDAMVEVRVRAEFMSDAQCSHPVVSDTNAYNRYVTLQKAGTNVVSIATGPPWAVDKPETQ